MHHYCLVSDNVLAVSVVISSAVANSANQSQMIFHIITDSVAYHAMQVCFTIFDWLDFWCLILWSQLTCLGFRCGSF